MKEEKEQQTNKRFIDLNNSFNQSKDNSMGVKFQTKEMERTKHIGITFCKEFNIYNFIGVEEKRVQRRVRQEGERSCHVFLTIELQLFMISAA